MRPSKLIELLSVPGTNQAPRFFFTHFAGNEPYGGWVEDHAGRVIARLREFRFDFNNPESPTLSERASHRQGPRQAQVPVRSTIGPFDTRIRWHGDSFELQNYLKGFHGHDRAAHLSFVSNSPAIEIALQTHAWSGFCRVEVDGIPFSDEDLFSESTLLKRVRIENPEGKATTIRIYPLGRANPASQGQQVILEYVDEFHAEAVTPAYRKFPARNRGGAFSDRFFELVAPLGPDAIILDIGGGKRQLDDPRYINLEYAAYEEPDILGDGTRLPFRDESIDLIYTAAVLEHVPDPLSMGREIHRVLKPGGRVLANSAFMQPVHSEGQHFFNLTPYGIDLTFGLFQERRVWWDCGFSHTIEWMTSLTEVAASVGAAKVDDFVALAREFDPHITESRAMYVASGVWLEARKEEKTAARARAPSASTPSEVAVIGWMRTGTTALRQLIGSTEHTFDLGEVFHGQTHRDNNFWGFLSRSLGREPSFVHPIAWPQAWRKFLELQRSRLHASTFAFDAKVEYFPFILRQDGLKETFFFDSPSTKYILLLRRNVLAQVLSERRAAFTNRWSDPNPAANPEMMRKFLVLKDPVDLKAPVLDEPVAVSADAVYETVRRISLTNDTLPARFGKLVSAELWYEDLFDADGNFAVDTVKRVAEVCDLDPRLFERKPIITKQAGASMFQGIANAQAVIERFRGSPYDWMLGEGRNLEGGH